MYKRVNRTNEFKSVKLPSVVGTSEAVPVNPQRCIELALSPMCAGHVSVSRIVQLTTASSSRDCTVVSCNNGAMP